MLQEVSHQNPFAPTPFLRLEDALVERGVRFVQVLSGDQHWDHHGGIVNAFPKTCRKVGKPADALVLNLKRTGLLDTTLIHWGGEIGRLPVIQNEAKSAATTTVSVSACGWPVVV